MSGVHKKTFIHLLSYFLFFVSLINCEKGTSPNNSQEVNLAVKYIGITEVEIELQTKKIEADTEFRLFREDSLINHGILIQPNTVITDSQLLPAHTYIYKAQLIKGGKSVANSQPLEITTLDTTSHNYVWTIDTIGTIGSTLLDVFAISENDVWVVGDVDTGSNQSFNAMHWDGTEWMLKRILFEYVYGTGYSTARCVYALSHNSVIVSDGGSIMRWNGTSWNSVGLFDTGDTTVIRGALTKIWGTSLNSLYGVGNNGTIIQYDGSSWQKLESGTDLRLTDVWGFADGSVYITGSSSSTLDNVFLVFKDNQLQKKIDDGTWRKKSVWGIASDRLYVAGSGLFFYDGNSLISILWPSNLPFIHVENLRGSEENNIFMVGHFGFVAHYNGSSWRYYPELYRYAIASSVAVSGNNVFVVGTDGSQAFIYHGSRIN